MSDVLQLTESAVDDLRSILAYYQEQGVEVVGKRLVRRVLQRVESLVEFPRLGRMVPEFECRELRELIVRPFRVVYFLFGEDITVVRVWRSERLLQLPVSLEQYLQQMPVEQD